MTKAERIHTEYNQKLSLPCCLRDHIINPLDRDHIIPPLIDNDNLVVKTFYTSLGPTT